MKHLDIEIEALDDWAADTTDSIMLKYMNEDKTVNSVTGMHESIRSCITLGMIKAYQLGIKKGEGTLTLQIMKNAKLA